MFKAIVWEKTRITSHEVETLRRKGYRLLCRGGLTVRLEDLNVLERNKFVTKNGKIIKWKLDHPRGSYNQEDYIKELAEFELDACIKAWYEYADGLKEGGR